MLYDTGEQTRCFTYVSDVIDGIIAAATHPGAIGEVFNLGNTRESTVAEVVETVCRQANLKEPPRRFDTAQEYGAVYEDIPRRVPSAEKAARILNWRATTELEEGVRRTIDWARAQMAES